MFAALCRHGQQLLFLVPVKWFVVMLGFVTALFQRLIQLDFIIRHEMQAVTGKKPQQVARHQVGDLRVALDDLTQDVLAQVLAFYRVLRQLLDQFVEALQF